MTLNELFVVLHDLENADKLRVIQFLANELVQQPEHLFQSGESYEIWSPYDAHDAADKLHEMLKAARTDE
jgi:hypothetical protein